MIRDDLSSKLVHLTKGKTLEQAGMNFLSIVASRSLRGGTGLIVGNLPCICFTEAPIGKLGHILAQPSVHGIDYAPLGVMIDKRVAFRTGGRPVFHQPESEYELLHESQRFRHKTYHPEEGVDYSWEREWRIQTDEFKLSPEDVTLVVPNRRWSDYFFKKHASNQGSMTIVLGETAGYMASKYPWHFLVLEDLGVPVRFDYLPS